MFPLVTIDTQRRRPRMDDCLRGRKFLRRILDRAENVCTENTCVYLSLVYLTYHERHKRDSAVERQTPDDESCVPPSAYRLTFVPTCSKTIQQH